MGPASEGHYMQRVRTRTMTTYTNAKINRNMVPKWFSHRSPGGVGTALRNIFKMLRNAMPGFPGHQLYGQLGEHVPIYLVLGVCGHGVYLHSPHRVALI